MTKKQRIRYDTKEAMSRNAAGAGRNTALQVVNHRYKNSSQGLARAKVIFAGPPSLKFW